jgi:hypothetical protein
MDALLRPVVETPDFASSFETPRGYVGQSQEATSGLRV